MCQNYAKHFTNVNSCNPHKDLLRTTTIPILQVKTETEEKKVKLSMQNLFKVFFNKAGLIGKLSFFLYK